MKALEIKKDIYWIGALDPELRIFDIIMYTPLGTTYNSYVVKGTDGIAVFETVKERFFDQYLERLKSLNINIEDISYIILDHTEPDHAGSVAKLLQIAKNAKVVGSASAIKFISAIANMEVPSIVVKNGDTLSLGNKTLKFISAPFLHWPDSIYTYLEEDNILFTCDSFGSHYCPKVNSENSMVEELEVIYNDKILDMDTYNESLKYYFDCIMSPFKSYVLSAIERIKDLKLNMVCPGHGPILRQDIQRVIDLYKTWSTPTQDDTLRVVISYVSAYGYTEALAQKIEEGIKASGDIEVDSFNIIYSKKEEILEKIGKAQGILFGSPTINGDALEPILDLLTSLNPIVHGKKVAAAFGSYGWSGEAVPNIEGRLKQLKLNILPGMKINFKPTEGDLKDAFRFGESFAEAIKEKLKKNTPQDKKSTTRKWRCIICGLVVEGSTPPNECPACGAGQDKFVEIKEESIEFESFNTEDYVILGNGAAGFYAAEAIRQRNKSCSIKIISKENYLSYFRPQLSTYLSKEIKFEDLFIKPDNWYEDNNIEVILNKEVIEINKLDKYLLLNDNTKVDYNKLIIASGSNNFIPKILGFYKKGVYTLRSLEDGNNIKAHLKDMQQKNMKNVVVVGGGLLGLEAASEIKKQGFNVTVIEMFPRLLPNQLDDMGAAILKTKVDESGLDLILDNVVSEIVGTNFVTGVKLKNGTILNSDLVLFSVGIKSEKSLAEDSNVKTKRGILVNDKMETNIKDIYACGDAAEFEGKVYGNWPAADEMGKVAGINAVGDEKSFLDFIPSSIFNTIGLELFSCGQLVGDGLKELSVVDKNKGIYKKLFFKENILCGGLLLGDTQGTQKLLSGIQNKIKMTDPIIYDLL
ncbi:MAG TPA: FAD-dependent oxidoreductase [Clostridiaceae bacterium]